MIFVALYKHVSLEHVKIRSPDDIIEMSFTFWSFISCSSFKSGRLQYFSIFRAALQTIHRYIFSMFLLIFIRVTHGRLKLNDLSNAMDNTELELWKPKIL